MSKEEEKTEQQNSGSESVEFHGVLRWTRWVVPIVGLTVLVVVIIGGISYFLMVPYKEPPREFEIHWATSKAHREMPQSIKKYLLEHCESVDDSPELVKVSVPNWNCSREPLEITRLIVEELNSGSDVDCLTDRLELNMENLCLCSVNSGNSPPIGETYVYPANSSLRIITNTGKEIMSDSVNVKIVDLEGY